MNDWAYSFFKKALHFFPPALFILMLGFFSYFAWNYKLLVDDFQIQMELKSKTILEASRYFYEGFNGRMASHFYLCSIFKIFENKENLFFIYHFLMLGAFLLSLAQLLRKFLETFHNKLIDFKTAFYYSSFITSFFFFFFFAGRVEVWFWISATGVYLISLILAFLAFAFVLNKKQNASTSLLSLILFFLIGGFSESFAVMYLLMLFYLLIFTLKKSHFSKNHLISIVLGMVGLIVALLINVLSSGIHNRLEWLPPFRIQQAYINTVHSLAFPILRWENVPLTLALPIIFLMYSRFLFPRKIKSRKVFLKNGLLIFVFISISFFIPTYLLSDIVPDRSASLGYFAGIFFLFDYFIFRSEEFPENKKGAAQ